MKGTFPALAAMAMLTACGSDTGTTANGAGQAFWGFFEISFGVA